MKWQSGKDLLITFYNMRTALQHLFEWAINSSYHSGLMKNTGMAGRGFENDKPPAILKCISRLYGTPRLQEIDQSNIFFHNPIDRNQLVEVMLRTTEKFQMFLMAHPDGDCELSDVNLIRYAMVKLSEYYGLYTNAI